MSHLLLHVSLEPAYIVFFVDSELFDNLEEAGFAVDRRGDFIDHLLVRFGGHYMNHGGSEKIIEGKIKVKGKSTIAAFSENGVEFQDGSKLDADLVVFATG